MTTGETILKDIALCIKKVILANGVEKKIYSERVTAANHLAEVRANLVVTRGLLTLGWALSFISHGAFMSLTSQMDEIEKQTTKWHAWFMNWQQQ
ncbi:hypothetical protein [Enterobacter sp. SLBN-59]|uniref:hypothetical protein n=1 Tax=Enterobacter sp. SLBN-59 TaxID=2940621 RepID=UPI0021677315|nr:hypothetical protein [Enterobacter sp. SLBN-59]MCS3490663.1 hypothetical protein [Enterobacter sp. SLBN-59]